MIPTNRHLIIAVEESDSSVGIYDSADGTEAGRVAVGRWPHEIEISADQKLAYITNFGLKDYDEHIGEPGSSISVIDLGQICETERLYTFNGGAEWETRRAPHGVKLSPDGSKLYVNVERSSEMLVYDLTAPRTATSKSTPNTAFAIPTSYRSTRSHSGRKVGGLSDRSGLGAFDLPHGSHNFIFSHDGQAIFLAAGPEGLFRLNAFTGEVTGNFRRTGPVRGLAWSADNASLIISSGDEICIVDPKSMLVSKSFGGLGVRQLLYSIPTPDGKYFIAPAVWEGMVLLVDAERGRVLRRIIVGADPIHVVMAPHGQSVYVSHGRSKFISEIGLDPFVEIRRIPTRGGPNGIAVIPFPANAPSLGTSRPVIRIGACIPLSGPNSFEGQDLRLGYQYWQELVNDAGGIVVGNQRYRVEVVLRDSRSEVSEGLVRRLTEELFDVEKVEFVFGGYPSPPNEFSGRVADERRAPFITASGAAERIYTRGFEYVFGIMSSANAFLKETLSFFMHQTPRPQSVTFLSCDDPAASQDAATTAASAVVQGYRVVVPAGSIPGVTVAGSVLLCPHLKPEPDDLVRLKNTYADVIRALQALPVDQRPDVFVLTGHLPESTALVEVAKALNYLPMAFAFSVGPAFPQFALSLGDSSLHMFNSAMWSAVQREYGHDQFVRPQDFARRFFERFSKQPSYLAAGAVACGIVLENAIRRASSKDGTAVRDALRLTNLDTFYSNVQFDPRGLNVNRPLITIQLQKINGEIVHVAFWPANVATNDVLVKWPFPGW